jgi:trehalose 6-phosphate synthase/phosphatase
MIIPAALTMPDDDKIVRMNRLRKREKEHDVNFWMTSFLRATGGLEEDGIETTKMEPVSIDDFDEYLSRLVVYSAKY